MKATRSLSKYWQKTVSGTQKYTIAPDFHQKMVALKQGVVSSKSDPEMPSRAALRQHKYYFSLPPFCLPDQLDQAATDYLREHSLYSVKHLSQLSTRLVNYLHERELLSERDIVERIKRKKGTQTPDDLPETEDVDPGIESVLQYHLDAPFVGADRAVREEQQADLSAWKYTEENSQLYLVGRLAPNFAVACRVLYELRKRCPLFVPHSFFDFASGLGTYTWVVNTVWPAGCIRGHYLVEASRPMTSLAEFLLSVRGQGIAPGTTVFPGVHHRRFMPSTEVTADLVMSGYALLEMAGERDRRRVVENLWARTTGFLVLIEEGTKAGHSALLEARDWLIQSGNRNGRDGEELHIFAPCPHSQTCGKSGIGCSSSVRYYNFGLTKDPAYPSSERFSYLVVSRGDWRRYSKEPEGRDLHPRIVSSSPVGKGSAFDVDLCLPNGECERVAFSKSGTHRTLYFFLKNARAGDIAPCERTEECNENNIVEEKSGIE
uniref:Mitochondrial small ribosomal subunit Rsm22 n=1 Tax=Mesocestoides corti TaxID=53468 RepID=A0A5K3ESJ6_MESCO